MILASVLCAALAGCGSGSGADFSAQANAICASTVRQLRAIGPVAPSGGGRAGSALAGYLGQALPIVQSESAELAKLAAPEGTPARRRLVARWRAAVRDEAHAFARLATAARTGEAGAIATAESELRASPTTALAAAAGLDDCAAPGATVA